MNLKIGDTSENGQITIIDEDRLCYLVKSTSRGAEGVRTISKSLLSEYIAYFSKNPNASANDARDTLSGQSDIDKFEYGYTSTLKAMAQMELGQIGTTSISIDNIPDRDFHLPLQQIFYGAPGTGKSHTINKETQGKSVIRTTFHPDSDYSTFVGSYKPTTKEVVMRDVAGHEIIENGKEVTEDRIVYEFVTQAFLQAYIEAWKKLAIGSLTIGNGNYIICGMKSDIVLWRSANSNITDNQTANKETIRKHFDGEITEDTKNNAQSVIAFYLKRLDQDFESAWTKLQNELSTTSPQYLIIEEINRGNCAQIFGDLFQLLDRNDYGFSDYPINADKDMKKQLAKAFNGLSINNADSMNRLYNGRDVVKEVLSGDILLLPNNLYIWATMNTSDQSLFPIDSAFKRRWDWKYVPIDTAKERWTIKVNGKEYSWTSFLDTINGKIYDKTQSEDKQLGFYFCKADNSIISAERFVSKVLFYVYNDVFKDYGFDDSFFNSDNGKLTFQGYYKTDGKINEEKVAMFLDNLEVDGIRKNVTED